MEVLSLQFVANGANGHFALSNAEVHPVAAKVLPRDVHPIPQIATESVAAKICQAISGRLH